MSAATRTAVPLLTTSIVLIKLMLTKPWVITVQS